MLCRPELRALYIDLACKCRRLCGSKALHRNASRCDRTAALVERLYIYAPPFHIGGSKVSDICRDLKDCVLIVLIQICADGIVLHLNKRLAGQIDVSVDTAVIEHILILEPGTVAELMYLYGQCILAVHEVICDIKLVRAEGILAVAHFFAVDIYIVS